MTSRNFEDWLKSFTDNINNWNYYVNYDTAYKNTASVKRQLALLNTLKGSENIEDEFRDLVQEYPECIKAIPLLLAVRENVIAITENDHQQEEKEHLVMMVIIYEFPKPGKFQDRKNLHLCRFSFLFCFCGKPLS